ncbi:MAG TPA: outer membrane beta-barrel protein [Hyphomicrobium sp.]|nr:outer membrane beta-barrel protein [Hyphomicrobium sp.]
MSVFARSRRLASACAVTSAALIAIPAPVAPARADYLAPIWSGVYAGVHGGANWADVDFSNIGSASSSAFRGGGHAGINLAFGQFIAGVEGDLDYDGSSFGYTTGGTIGSVGVNWAATLRGRIGMNVGPALLYATAGFAWKDVSVVETSLGGLSASNSEVMTGVVYGIGAETYVMPNLSLRLEALRYDYGSEGLSVGGAAAALQEIDPSDTVVRAGVTFHLN